ncbi:MAG: formate dehydrogenase accessory sulfurtransferase FdhD [Chitinophagaceae bacterium]
MQHPSIASVQINKIRNSDQGLSPFLSEDALDLLAVEDPLEIRILFGPQNQQREKSISVTMCTPGHDFELAIGFLFTEGIITQKEDVLHVSYLNKGAAAAGQDNIVLVQLKEGIQFDPQKIERHFYTSSSCGVCGKSSIAAVKQQFISKSSNAFTVDAATLMELPFILRNKQEVFEQTGGLHASALYNLKGSMLMSREDVGRHNALDKLIGACLMEENIPLQQHILLLSGRASFELIQKAAMAGIQMVCAVGAPSSLAVSLAEERGMTLVGFLRDRRFNIYTGRERIIFKNYSE